MRRILKTSAIEYPIGFPCFNRDGYSMELDLGLVRAESDVLTYKQRRAYTNLPTMIQASVTIPAHLLYSFTVWLNNNVGLWVDLPLAHPFMLRDQKVEIVPARILDFTLPQSYQVFGNVVGVVTIQLSPTVFIDNKNDTDIYQWIIAGSVTVPSPDWTIARRVTNPAPDWVIAGDATNPGAP